MGEGAESESIFVDVRGVTDHLHHDVTAAYVVHEIANFLVAERIVAHVLNDATAIGVSVGFFELLRSQVGKFLQEKRLDLVFPGHVHDFFMGQDGIRIGRRTEHDEGQQNANCPDEVR